MITVTITGDKALIAKLSAMPNAVRAELRKKVNYLADKLQHKIQDEKLSGQVLHVVTGALRRSIHKEVREGVSSVTAIVGSSGDVKYAGIHEFGGHTAAHVIEAVKAQALAFMVGGKLVFAKCVNHPGSNMPERSYLRSSLGEMSSEIEQGLKDAVLEGLKK